MDGSKNRTGLLNFLVTSSNLFTIIMYLSSSGLTTELEAIFQIPRINFFELNILFLVVSLTIFQVLNCVVYTRFQQQSSFLTPIFKNFYWLKYFLHKTHVTIRLLGLYLLNTVLIYCILKVPLCHYL